jgi:Copper transport outer membrane protein, MctB
VINFRYHVVSLTAVFLALAIGLVVGTAALNGPLADSLNEQVSLLGQQNQELRDRVNHLNNDVEQREEFATQLAPVVLANKLLGDRVLVMSVPSGREYAGEVIEMLEDAAGATVVGQIDLEEKFAAPEFNAELLDLAHMTLPSNIATNVPRNSDGVESSAALLATVLLDHTPAPTVDDLQAVLTAYRNAGYLGMARDVAGPAEAVVLISGPPVTGEEANRRNASIVTFAAQFDKAGHLVVAASADAGDGNIVAELRGDPQLAQNISTVDNVSTPQGRLVTAWAVADQIARRPVGHYGIGSGTTLLPEIPQ